MLISFFASGIVLFRPDPKTVVDQPLSQSGSNGTAFQHFFRVDVRPETGYTVSTSFP